MLTILSALLGCGDDPPPEATTATPWSAAAPPASEDLIPASEVPPPPPVDPAPAPTGTTHCRPDERVVFSCPTKGHEVLSVCGGPADGALQYRFGPLGAPELVYPPEPSVAAFELGPMQLMHAEGATLRFVHRGVRYEVTSLTGSGCCSPEQGAANNFQGVYVHAGRGKVVGIGCTAPAEDHLGELRSAGVPPLTEPE